MTTTNTAAPSLIAALHARFEANDAEYQRIESHATLDQPHERALSASERDTVEQLIRDRAGVEAMA